jgi:uncharacterized protein (TIGR03067 family)
MSPRTKAALVIAVWVVPLAVGAMLAAWIVGRPSAKVGTNEPVEPASVGDWQRLQGTWEGIRVERNGKVLYRGLMASQARVSFARDNVVFEDHGARLEGNFTVDDSRTPKTFDLVVMHGGIRVNYPVGIYHLSGDILRLCFAFPSPERPTTFETSPGSGRTFYIYRRAQISEGTHDETPPWDAAFQTSTEGAVVAVRRR